MQAHSCAVLRGGSVRCWGYNGYAQVMIVVDLSALWVLRFLLKFYFGLTACD
jgi:hypothetical protein